MSLNFLEYLDKYEQENVGSVRKIVEGKKKKVDSIIKEAFKGDFVSKDEAIIRVKNDFIKKSPKNIDTGFLKENMNEIVKKIDMLSEGEIKIVVNNYESGSKSKITQPPVSVVDTDDELGLEGTKPKKKRGRPKKNKDDEADREADETAKEISKKNEKNVDESDDDLENIEDEIDEANGDYVVMASENGKDSKIVSKPMDKMGAERFKKDLESKSSSTKKYSVISAGNTDESKDNSKDFEESEEKLNWTELVNNTDEEDEQSVDEKCKDKKKVDEEDEDVEESFEDVNSFLNTKLASLGSKKSSIFDTNVNEETELPDNIVADFEQRAQSEREGGATIDIDFGLPTIAIKMSDGSEYFFQEHEASDLLDDVPENISAEDYILAVAHNW